MKYEERYVLKPYGLHGHTQIYDTLKKGFFGGVGFREHEQELARRVCAQWNTEELRQHVLALQDDIFALVTTLNPSIRTWAQFYETPIGVACKKKSVTVMQRFLNNHRKSQEDDLLRSWVGIYIQAIAPDNRIKVENKAFIASVLQWELSRMQEFYSQVEGNELANEPLLVQGNEAIKAEIEAITTALMVYQQFLEVENAKRQKERTL